jgi:preprotein translocase subunit SecA
MEEDVPIESKMITKRIAAAQKAVEAQNFAARKHLLEYDDVMDKQRKAVYGLRNALLEGQDMRERFLDIIRGILESYLEIRCPEKEHASGWDLVGLQSDVLTEFGIKINPSDLGNMSRGEIEEFIYELLVKRYSEKEKMVGYDLMRDAERTIMLSVIDNQWRDHLLSMDHLKEGIGLRGYGQKDPLIEYKKESFQIFQDMMDRIEDETVRYLFFLQGIEPGGEVPLPYPEMGFDDDDEEGGEPGEPVAVASQPVNREAQKEVLDFTANIQRKKEREMAELQFIGGESTTAPKPVLVNKKAGRNDPCPCGSGKKYKKCCGA